MEHSPKRQRDASDLSHREKGHKSTGSIFRGFNFCFPVVDLQLTPKQIDLLSASIAKQGGRVVKFVGKAVNETIDLVAVNPKLPLQGVREKIDGKLKYKEIIDYHFITDSLRAGRVQNFEKFSLFINVEQLEAEAKEVSHAQNPKKRQKMDEQEHDSDITVKLSQDQHSHQHKREHSHSTPSKASEKVDIEELMMHQKKGAFSVNAYIADELTKLMKIYATEGDKGRRMAYMKAAAVIRGLDKQIQSEKDVENLRGIGDKIAKKIKELLQTGKINKLQTLQGEEKNVARGKMSEVWGVGPAKANQLYSMGIKSIEDMRKRTDLLNRNQKIGLKYFEQFQQKIPREKVTRMFDFVKNVIETMVASIDMYNIQVCGSYRRGKKECGDMDVIISRKDGVFEKNFLNDLVRQLETVGFLTDHLTHPKPSQERTSMSYMGVCRFDSPTHHRIDIKYYPIEEYAYAILYFTGSGNFNRMLRLHTMKLGLTLSDKGATPKMEKGVIWDKPIPTCLTEKDIFDFLGLDYKTPQQRDI